MTTLKRMFLLQKMKIDILWDAIDGYIDTFQNHADTIPDSMKEDFIKISKKLLKLNARIDRVREKNISNFYNKLKNKYEGIYNMEAPGYEEGKEED